MKHAQYDIIYQQKFWWNCDGTFAGDSVGLGQGQRLNFIFKKLTLKYFGGKIAPDEKNTVYSSAVIF